MSCPPTALISLFSAITALSVRCEPLNAFRWHSSFETRDARIRYCEGLNAAVDILREDIDAAFLEDKVLADFVDREAIVRKCRQARDPRVFPAEVIEAGQALCNQALIVAEVSYTGASYTNKHDKHAAEGNTQCVRV